MSISPHNQIFTKHKNCRSRTLRISRTILNKWEGRMLHQKTHNPWLLISRPLRTVGKQPSPTLVTTTMLLWVLSDQYYTHDLCNVKQMSNKTNPYWKNRPGRSLPPDTCKHENHINMNCNSRQAIFSLFEFTLWHHTCNSGIYDYQWRGNRPRQQSTSRSILGNRWS